MGVGGGRLCNQMRGGGEGIGVEVGDEGGRGSRKWGKD